MISGWQFPLGPGEGVLAYEASAPFNWCVVNSLPLDSQARRCILHGYLINRLFLLQGTEYGGWTTHLSFPSTDLLSAFEGKKGYLIQHGHEIEISISTWSTPFMVGNRGESAREKFF